MASKSKRQQQRKVTQKATQPPNQYVAAPKAPPPPVKKQRGGWLTAMIVIIAFHGVFNTVALLSMRKAAYSQVPPWLWAVAFLDGILTVLAAVALWYWKKWGLWVYLVATAASIVVGLFVYPSQIVVFYNLIPLLILVYILQGQKKMAQLA